MADEAKAPTPADAATPPAEKCTRIWRQKKSTQLFERVKQYCESHSKLLETLQVEDFKAIAKEFGQTPLSCLKKTKEILKTWPLTTVRRWAASPNVFTLDFGDYQDQYYSVQTTEGEQISQLIAGYIDIILKRRQRRERFGDDGNEEEAMEEDLVTPGRAITMVGLPGPNYNKVTASNVAKPGIIRPPNGKKLLLFYVLVSLFLFRYNFVGTDIEIRQNNFQTDHAHQHANGDGGAGMNGVRFIWFLV